jgi:hypothetical protein
MPATARQLPKIFLSIQVKLITTKASLMFRTHSARQATRGINMSCSKTYLCVQWSYTKLSNYSVASSTTLR